MEDRKSIVLFGGRICEELNKRNLFPEQNYNVMRMETMLNAANFPDGSLPEEVRMEQYDFLVMDLQSAIEERISNTVSPDRMQEWIRRLAEEIKQRFPEERLLLLHVFRPPYYVIDDRIRVQTVKPYGELIREVEQAFLECCACHVISLHNCYFSRKPYGGKLALYSFEDEYYQEIVQRINAYLLEGRSVFGDGPDYSYGLDRFRRYFRTLETKAFYLFLDRSRILEDLVLYFTPEFLERYGDILVHLAKQAGTGREMGFYLPMTEGYGTERGEELAKILRAFDAVCKGEYQKTDVDYLYLFEKGMRSQPVLEELRKWAKDNLEAVGLKHPKQITFYNYGAYFVWKQTGSREAFEAAVSRLSRAQNAGICTKPVVLDIWGSCVSRVNLNFDDERTLVVSVYNFQVPPFIETAPVSYDEKKIAKCKTWYDQIVRKQLKGTVVSDLENSPAEWLLVDFFSLSSQRVYRYQGRYFTDYYEKIAEGLGAEKCSLRDIPMEEMRSRLRIFAKTLKKRYGNHIIFVQTKRQESYLTQELQIMDFANKEKNIEINKFVDELSKYFVYLTQCYYINITDHFYADELGFMKLSEVHYENECYEETLKLIHHIVEQEPEKHWFCSYSSEADRKRVKRIEGKEPADLPPEGEVKLSPFYLSYRNEKKGCTWLYQSRHGKVCSNRDGTYSYMPNTPVINNGTARFEENRFCLPGYESKGYYLRVRTGEKWLWYTRDGEWSQDTEKGLRLFRPYDCIPVISVGEFESIEAYCVWENTFVLNRFSMYYYAAKSEEKLTWTYDESDGEMVHNPSGSYEYRCGGPQIINDGKYILKRNCFHRGGYEFSGWKLRVKCGEQWYWYMEDHTLKQREGNIPEEEFSSRKALLSDGAALPVLPLEGITLVIAEAVWTKSGKKGLFRSIGW